MSAGGDVFIHAKSDNVSKLFELCQAVTAALGSNIDRFEDIYSFVYKNGRDLSGFIDGTVICTSMVNKLLVKLYLY